MIGDDWRWGGKCCGCGRGGIDVNGCGFYYVIMIVVDVCCVVGFYVGLLGLQWIKKIVCYDDFGSYYIYYGDVLGILGLVIMILVWNCVNFGMIGVGDVVQMVFCIVCGFFV